MQELLTEDGDLWAVDLVSDTRRVYAHRQPLTDSVRLFMLNRTGSVNDYLVPEERATLAKLLLTGLPSEQILTAIPEEWVADHDDEVALTALANLTPRYGIKHVNADGTPIAHMTVLAMPDRDSAADAVKTFDDGSRAVLVEQLNSDWTEVN